MTTPHEHDAPPPSDSELDRALVNAFGDVVSSEERDRPSVIQRIGNVAGGKLKPDVLAKAAEAGHNAKRTDIQGLFETFVPESKRRARLGPKPKLEDILKLATEVAGIDQSSSVSTCTGNYSLLSESEDSGLYTEMSGIFVDTSHLQNPA